MHNQTKTMIKEAVGNLRSLVYNLLYFSKHSPYDDSLTYLRNSVLSLPLEIRNKYAAEYAYVESIPLENLTSILFPYPEDKDRTHGYETVIGKERGLPFVVYGEGGDAKKLFFPYHMSPCQALREFHGLVDKEGLLGNGTLVKSPHCYQDRDFKVEAGDVLLDVGCAEAVFSLDNIDKVSKVYLFECLPEWRKPLKFTFAPYAEKVVFVNKLVSDRTQGNSTTLMDVIRQDMLKTKRFFVKMDIEGWERQVVNGNVDFFKFAQVKLSCCVYHRQDDAQIINKMLSNIGYKTRFSEGYMLPVMNGVHYPYFRHGVIYAQNY